MRAVLDEAADICKIADLPDLYSPRLKGNRADVDPRVLPPGCEAWGGVCLGSVRGPGTLARRSAGAPSGGNLWALTAGWGSREIQDVTLVAPRLVVEAAVDVAQCRPVPGAMAAAGG